MKVYEINVTGVFSTGTIVKNIQRRLLDKGDECRFAFGHGGKEDENSFALSGIWRQRLDIRAERVFGRGGLFYKGKTRKLIRDIKEFSPDIIHLHNLHGNYLDLKKLLRFLAEYDRPVILTLHDCWAFTGGCTHFTENECYKWETECNACAYKTRYFVNRILPKENKEFSAKKKLFGAIKNLTVTTVSEWLKNTAERSFFKERPIVTVYNGIDTNVFKKQNCDELRNELGLNGKKVVLGVASTWSEGKGLSKWKELSENLPDGYKIVLVGLNKEQTESFNGNVIALPRVKETNELVLLYNLADVYVSLSLEETFGLPTAEALSCGTPAIVLNSTACPEVVDKNTGIVLEKYSTEALIDAVRHLANRKAEISDYCVKRVKDCFSVGRMVESYCDLYDSVLSKNDK